MSSLALSNILYTNLNSFYPVYMNSYHPSLTTLHFGIMISVFGIANFITSLFLGKNLSKFQRKKLVIHSYVLLFCSTLAFVFLFDMPEDSDWAFFWVTIFLRVLQGIAGAAI